MWLRSRLVSGCNEAICSIEMSHETVGFNLPAFPLDRSLC